MDRRHLFAALMLMTALPLCAQTTSTSPTTSPASPWHVWIPYDKCTLKQVSPNYAWLAAGGVVAQIDLKTHRYRFFTSMDGLPLDTYQVQRLDTSADDRCLMLLGVRSIYVWEPKTGWAIAPPPPEGTRWTDAAFGTDGRVFALAWGKRYGTDVYVLEGEQWKHVLEVPGSRWLLPLKDGCITENFDTPDRKMLLCCTTWAGQSSNLDDYASRDDIFRVGGGLVAFGGKKPADGSKRWLAVARQLTESGMKDLVSGDLAGIDLKENKPLPVKAHGFTENRRNGVTWFTYRDVEVLGRKLTLPAPMDASVRPLRAADDTVYANLYRWDGQHWSLPPEAADAAAGLDPQVAAMQPYQLSFDPRHGWRRGPGADLTAYDPVTHQGWSMQPDRMELVERTPGRQQKVLRQVPLKDSSRFSPPLIKDASGHWWGVVFSRYPQTKGLYRLQPDNTLKPYTLDGAHGFAVSPKGRLWVIGGNGASCYDPAKDAFGVEDWRDEFAFTLGSIEFTCLSQTIQLEIDGKKVTQRRAVGRSLYRKVDGQWEEFRLRPGHQYGGQVCGTFLHRQRMLITVPAVGVLEYDGNKDRWARLTDCYFLAGFDEAARRILIGDTTLVYDADPFDPPTGLTAADIALFRTLLQLMDDESYRKREAATAEMGKLAQSMRAELQRAAEDESLSVEVRERIRELLAKTKGSDDALLPPALFRQQFPLLTQPLAPPRLDR